MVPLMRNHGASFYAMCSMALGCIVNIILDYYFVLVLNLGIKGAALATVFGQVITLFMCGAFYLQKKHRFPLSLIDKTAQPYRAISRALVIRLNTSVSVTSRLARSLSVTPVASV